MRTLTTTVLAVCCFAGSAMGTDLTPQSEAWRLPGKAAVWMENGAILQVNATAPHHTTIDLLDADKLPGFLMTLRVNVIDWTGSAPGLYFYSHREDGKLQALSVSSENAALMGWYGRGESGLRSGSVWIGYEKGAWLHVKLLCRGMECLAKVWRDGQPEPRWQVVQEYDRIETLAPGLGVWTHPQNPSTASVQFADVSVVPITDQLLADEGAVAEARAPLAAEQIPGASGCFRAGAAIGIRGERLAMAFDPQDGRPFTARDMVSGQEFCAPIAIWDLFRLTLRSPDHLTTRTFGARDFLRVTATGETGTDTLTLRFDQCITDDIVVGCTVTVGEGGELRFGAAVTVGTGEHVAGLLYPQIPCTPELASEGEDDAIIIPVHEGVVVHRPGAKSVSHSNVYPGSAFAQFAAYYGNKAGLYIAAHDPDGWCKRVHTQTTAGMSVCVAWEYLFAEDGRKTVETPYDTVVDRIDGGDWRLAADHYKTWAKNQPWCAKTLDQREDIPAFLTDACGILIDSIRSRGPNGLTGKYGPNLEQIPDVIDQYREATGLKHIVFIPYGWENRGTWAGIHYLPAFPSNELWRDMAAELKKRGNRVGMLTSGFWWVVKRQTNGCGPGFDDSADLERMGDMCIREPDGEFFKADNYDRPNSGASWRGLSVRLCHGSKAAQENLTETFLGVARLGVPLISFDQEIGGGMPPCYDTRHGHAPGFGRYPWTGLEATCQAILEEGKKIEPELGLFMENTSEIAIPYMATYWSRQFAEVHGHGGRSEGIALFSYLYHEYVTAIGAACVQGQGKAPTKEMRGKILANNLVRGLIPGPFMGQVRLEGGSEWQQYVSQAYVAFCKPYRHYSAFLQRGRTLHPPALTCEKVTTAYSYKGLKNGKKLSSVDVEIDAVVAGAYEASDGRRLAVVANAMGTQQKATVNLPPDGEWQEYGLDGKVLENGGRAGLQELDLEPFACRIYIAKAK